jgi:hypothetical protein
MNRQKLALGLSLISLCLAPSAFGQVYAGAGYTALQVNNKGGTGDDVTLGAITGRVGYDFNSYFAVEGEASVGVADDSYRLSGPPSTNVTVKLDSQVGAFAVGKIPIPKFGTLFGRAGFASTNLSPNGPGIDDGSGIAYGGGVEFGITDKFKGRLDYTKYGSTAVQAFGVSGVFKF